MRSSRIVLGLVLVAHGVGHVLGVLAPWLGDADWNLGSWLLPDATPEWVGMIGFGVAAVLFIAAGLAAVGLIVPERNLRWSAEVAAVISILALVIWWDAFPSVSSKVAALAIDAVVLVAALPERKAQRPARSVGPVSA